MKRFVVLLLAVSLLGICPVVSAAGNAYKDMTKIGVAITDDKGNVLLPIRAFFEAVGHKVSWDGRTGTVRTKYFGVERFVFTVGSAEAIIDGKTFDLGAPVVNRSGTTYFLVDRLFQIHAVDPSTLEVYIKNEFLQSNTFVNVLTKTGTGLVREVPAMGFKPTEPLRLTAESSYPRWASQSIGEADVRWIDCVKSLTKAQQEILSKCAPNITFNADTVFPDIMPKTYNPAAILEAGKNPGLGVRSLQAQGITGKGVGIAIIDQTLYTRHPEYRDNLALYEEIHVMSNSPASMHGSAVSSIAVGKSCGVAPGAKLYYWSVDLRKDFDAAAVKSDADIAFADGLAAAVDRVIQVNKTLPDGEKIRVISISRGFSDLSDPGVKAFLEAVKRAEAAGIFVITTRTSAGYSWLSPENDFGGLGKANFTGNPDALSTYTLGTWEQGNPDAFKTKLMVPMDARTTADFTGDGYVFYADGGWSWVAPYLAGLYAMACQVKPDVTPEEFWKTALDTADSLKTTIQTGKDTKTELTLQHVINPVKLIEALKK